MPRLSYLVSSMPLYYCFKCPHCSRRTVGVAHLKAASPAILGRSANAKRIAKQISKIQAKKAPLEISCCDHCRAMSVWDKPFLSKLSTALLATAITLSVFALGLFYPNESRTVGIISAGLMLACILAHLGIKAYINALYKHYAAEYEIIFDTDPKRLYQAISNKFTTEEINNIHSLNFTLLN